MTDETAPATSNDAPVGEPLNVPIQVVAHYVKDMSFENPNAMDLLRSGGPTGTDQINVTMSVRPLTEADMYEVSLRIAVKGGGEQNPAYVVELEYAGLFRVGAAPQNVTEQILAVECPRMLFPYASIMIANATVAGGLPPLVLKPLDFGAAYASQRGQAAGSPVGNA
ncbi:MAG: protein-export chaperone SecB [Hyphomonadaceae bacterium]|nr:protein-export chaperone SecB [Hyphomonadaceae bacterium]